MRGFLVLAIPVLLLAQNPRAVTRFVGHGVPGSLPTSILGDKYIDSDAGLEYTCFSASGGCRTVASGGWVLVTMGLGNVDNTADTAKPISTATQTALDLKSPLASPTFTGTVSIGATATVLSSNVAGVDALQGKGNFPANGLTGWTVITPGAEGDWSIIGGKLSHDPMASGASKIQVPITVVAGDIYLLNTSVASQTSGTVALNLGANCDSDCTFPLLVGSNLYPSLSYANSTSYAFQIQASAGSDIQISSITVLHAFPTIYSTALYSPSNAVLGVGALANNTSGAQNVAIGSAALGLSTSGGANVAIGESAMVSTLDGSSNVAIGNNAIFRQTTAYNNAAVGFSALFNEEDGSSNVSVGAASCGGIIHGTGNVCVGYNAGGTTDTSNKLFVDNSQTDSPLIGGDFSARTVAFDGGTSILYRCSVAGTLRAGQLTTVSSDCGTAVDTGLRVK